MKPTVVVVDATAFVRAAVKSALTADGIDVVAELASVVDALTVVANDPPDAILIDADLDPEMSAVRQIAEAAPETAVIILAPGESVAQAMSAVRAGACGFIPKETAPDRLPAIVRGALDGEAAIPRRLVRKLLGEIRRAETRRSIATGVGQYLSARECEVLGLQSEGFSDRVIAERLAISQVTVRRHSASAMRKLGAPHREGAVAIFRGSSNGAPAASTALVVPPEARVG